MLYEPKPTLKAELKAELKIKEAWLEVPEGMDMKTAVKTATQEGYKIQLVDKENRRIQIWLT